MSSQAKIFHDLHKGPDLLICPMPGTPVVPASLRMLERKR
jgi:hypothetical protein